MRVASLWCGGGRRSAADAAVGAARSGAAAEPPQSAPSSASSPEVPVSPMVADMMRKYNLSRASRIGGGGRHPGDDADGRGPADGASEANGAADDEAVRSRRPQFLRVAVGLLLSSGPMAYVLYSILAPVPEEQHYWIRFERLFREGRLHELEEEERAAQQPRVVLGSTTTAAK